MTSTSLYYMTMQMLTSVFPVSMCREEFVTFFGIKAIPGLAK